MGLLQFGVVYWLLIFLPVTFVSSKHFPTMYNTYDFEKVCRRHGSKPEISWTPSQVSIFTFNENTVSTYERLRYRDFSCQVEFEDLDTNYGYHIYIDEMNLDKSSDHRQCKDHLQFGRDTWGIDSYRSKEYCGKRRKLNYATATKEEFYHASNDGPRMYIESSDNDMDIYLNIKANNGQHRSYNRTLTLIVTAFKRRCGKNDVSWQKCKRSNYCVQKDLFCDGHPNCGWPKGNIASDELGCEGYATFSPYHHNGLFIPSNIPVVIIVTVVIIGCVVLAAVVTKRITKLYRVFQDVPRNPNTSNTNPGGNLNAHGVANSDGIRSTLDTPARSTIQPAEPIIAFTSLGGGSDATILSDPSAPPSYDEAVKLPLYLPNVYSAEGVSERSKPPPYSPSSQ